MKTPLSYRRLKVATLVFWLVVGFLLTCPAWRNLETLEPGDDWTTYEQRAQGILAGDWAGGTGRLVNATFLYPYVIAGLHAVLGPKRWPIYWVQYVWLGVACLGMGVLGERLFRNGTLVLVAANVVALLDVARWYPIRLLSENLLLPLLPWVFLAIASKRKFLTGLLLGCIALTRANLLVFCLVALMLAGGWTGFLIYGFLPLREWVTTGFPYPFSGAGPGAYRLWWINPPAAILSVAQNALFMLGFPSFVDAAYRVRPHWPLIWLLYALWWRRHAKSAALPDEPSARKTLRLVHLYIVLYVAVMLVTPVIGVYGFRHVLGLVLMLTLFVPAPTRTPTGAPAPA